MTKKKILKQKILRKSKNKAVASKLILIPEPGSPLIFVDFALKYGSLQDPVGKSGVASLTLSMLLRGTKKRIAADFHKALDNMGAEIHLGKYKESLRIYGIVLTENLPAFMDLLEELLTEPRFSEEEFVKIKTQFHSALLDELGSDEDIAERRFQEYLLAAHPYGRNTSGSLASLEKIQLDDLKLFYQKHFVSPATVFSATGNFAKNWMTKRMQKILDKFPEGNFTLQKIPDPIIPAGKNFLLLNKPGRTQSQVYIGAKGIAFSDKDYLPMIIANHVFGGGSFSARLMKEVREKRGWSYGAYAWFRSGRRPLYFAMQTVPSNKDTVPAIELMIKLLAEYGKNGISKEEFDFAKKSLVNQSAFMQDTIRKRLDNKVTEEILDLPKGFYDSYVRRLKSLSYVQVQKAIRKNIEAKNVFVLVLCSVDQLKQEFENIKGVKSLQVKAFDEDPSVSVG